MMRLGALFGVGGVWVLALMGMGCNSDKKPEPTASTAAPTAPIAAHTAAYSPARPKAFIAVSSGSKCPRVRRKRSTA